MGVLLALEKIPEEGKINFTQVASGYKKRSGWGTKQPDRYAIVKWSDGNVDFKNRLLYIVRQVVEENDPRFPLYQSKFCRVSRGALTFTLHGFVFSWCVASGLFLALKLLVLVSLTTPYSSVEY